MVSRRELLDAGVGRRRIERWLADGRLHRLHRGVYAIGRPDVPVAGLRRAAVLACGDGAVLSHRSAAAAWGVRPEDGAPWDVTQPTRRAGHHEVLRIFRNHLRPEEQAVVDGLPCTTVARTLFDLAAVVRAHHLRRAVEEAERLELLDVRPLNAILARQAGRPGAPALAALLRDLAAHGIEHTRSDVEAALLQICLDHGLPRPQVNRYANGREVDFRWPSHRLVVEVDGWTWHRTRASFAHDRARDRALLAEGWRVARFPASEILRAPAAVAAELTTLLDEPVVR